ncbi:MAG TPA: response regulator transcription factor, partial [Oceanipulchritudo sp.]|nr:response regulator transcription factor [Oceanipulchritudo sp.]
MKVVVVEDQVLFQEFLVDLLRNRLELEIAGIADNGEDALEIIRETRPELLVLDILIPRLSGIHVARTVQKECPSTRILAISSENDIKTIHQVHRLRLMGFVDKNEASVDILVEAVHSILRGKPFFSESLKLTVKQLKTDPKAFQKILTRREQEVLSYIGGGLSDEEIGHTLGLSTTSIQSHRQNLFRKLHAHSTPELIRSAQEPGFWKASFKRMGIGNSYYIH